VNHFHCPHTHPSPSPALSPAQASKQKHALLEGEKAGVPEARPRIQGGGLGKETHTHPPHDMGSLETVRAAGKEGGEEGGREGEREDGRDSVCSLSFDPFPSPRPPPRPPSLSPLFSSLPPSWLTTESICLSNKRVSTMPTDSIFPPFLSPSPSCPLSLLSFLPTPLSSLPSPVPSLPPQAN